MATLSTNAKRPDVRQLAWEAIRRIREFTLEELRIEVQRPLARKGHGELKASTLRSYVDGLTNAGYLTSRRAESTGRGFPPAVWTLERDIGVEAPRVRKDGSHVTAGRGREQLWRTMRIIGDFDHHELAVQASTEVHPIATSEAAYYCQYLRRAGYLAVTAEGGPNRPTRYRLLKARYTGPQAPQIQRIRQVWDPNKEEVVWRPEDGSDE